ncbi:MAG: TerC family protein [Thermoguttaceae bacterium]
MGTDIPSVELWQWFLFGGFVIALLAADMLLLHRSEKTPTLRESAIFVAMWCAIAIGFNIYLWHWRGGQAATEFLTGYLLEWSLSMDNVFVFAVIFRFFHVPPHYQYRVLFWGILGAIVLRLAFVLAGVQLIRHFDWVLPLFGVLLIYTAVKLAVQRGAEVRPENNLVLRFARQRLPVSRGGHHEYGHAFFVREAGRLRMTPLFLVLLVVESSDIMFAVDSVPAILGITSDAFVVFTSNVFAILGLRALYFLLAGAIEKFRHLHYGLSAVLAFVGLSMIGDYAVTYLDHMKAGGHLVPTWAKLLVIAAALGASIVASLVSEKKEKKR